MVIVWPIVFELSWLSGGPSEQRIYGQTSKRPP
jgi:hypothetical protein